MAGLFGIIKPQHMAYTNVVTNPSCRSTTGFTKVGATGTLVFNVTGGRRGWGSISWIPGVEADSRIYYAVATTAFYVNTFSVDVKGAPGNTYRIFFSNTSGNGTPLGTPVVFQTTGKWQRVSVSYYEDSGATRRLAIDQNGVVQSGTLIVDGWQCIHSGIQINDLSTGFDPGYIDGDQKDCFWTGVPHASTSVRIADSREGGREIMLQDLGFYIDDAPGTGAPELTLHMQNYALLPGTMDLGYKINGRSFSLVGYIVGTSIEDLHTKRKALFDLVKPDLNPKSTSMIITYASADLGTKTRIRARYQGGMSFGSVAGFQEGYRERIALRFYADNPFWYEDGEVADDISVSRQELVHYAMRFDRDNEWDDLSTGGAPFLNGTVYDMAVMPNGHIILGGEFFDVGSASGDYIVDFNPLTKAITALGTGVNGAVMCLAVSPSGILYVGGNFTSAGGVANTAYLASWNGSVWSSVGAGAHGLAIVNALQFDQNGNLYIGGSSGAGSNGFKMWNGTAYSTPGSGTAGAVQTLTLGPDGFIYLGGVFTLAGGVSGTIMIARWTGAAYQSLGGGVTTGGAVYAIEFDEAGNLYAGGNFAELGGVVVNYVGMWNGSVWSGMGGGTDGSVVVLKYIKGLLYVGGYFSYAGGIATAGEAAIWNGSTWAHISMQPPVAGSVQVIMEFNGELYFGFDATGWYYVAYKTVITNEGTAISYPKLTISRSGGTSATAAYLQNATTGATIWLNYPLQDGEVLTLDFSPGNRSCISSVRGNVLGTAILRNSDFAEFNLIPGDNDILVFATYTGSLNVFAYLYWPLTHWALDGGVV